MVEILLAFMIWWDHPNIFNHLSFPYIRRYFSWKRFSKKLRLMKVELAKIVWRILHWIIIESLISVHQFIVDLIHSTLEQVCVLEKRVIGRGPCNIKDLVVISTFISI